MGHGSLGKDMPVGDGYRAPRIRDIIAGVLLFVALLLALMKLGDLMKLAGVPFMWLPAELGIIHRLQSQEVSLLDLGRSTQGRLVFPEAGRYAIYTGDYDLLVLSDALEAAGSKPWMTLRELPGGAEVPARLVHRGMRPYDTHLARGRPVITLDVPRAGTYELVRPTRPAYVYLVRDYVTGREAALAVLFWFQAMILLSPLFYFFGRRTLRRRRAIKDAQRQRRQEAEEIWQRQRDRKQHPNG